MRVLLRSGVACVLAVALVPAAAPAQTTVTLPDVAGGRALPLPLPTPVDDTIDRVTTPLNDTLNGITGPLTGQQPPASSPSAPTTPTPSTPQSSMPSTSSPSPSAAAAPGSPAGAAPSRGATPTATQRSATPTQANPSRGGDRQTAQTPVPQRRATTRAGNGSPRGAGRSNASPRAGQPRTTRGAARSAAATNPTTPRTAPPAEQPDRGPLRTVVEKAPTALVVAVIALALLGLAMAASSARNAISARRLRRQRGELQRDVGALQDALLPPVIDGAFGVAVGVKSIPAEGPAAGGDFHDVVALPGRRLGIVVGDISGHGREALGSTALVHYTVRAYLEAGLAPREAIRLAGRTLDEKLGTDFATVACAIYDPEASRLDYAVAGHPAPIVTGAASDQALPQLTPPPIGMGLPTGFRQTSVPLSAGQGVCLFTDGVVEARTRNGDALLGREGLIDLLRDHGTDPDALVAALHKETTTADDVTTVLLGPEAPHGAGPIVEEIEVDPAITGASFDAFCRACGLSDDQLTDIQFTLAARGGSAQLRIERAGDAASWTVADPGEVALAAALPT